MPHLTSSRPRPSPQRTRRRRRPLVWPGTPLPALPRCTPPLSSKARSMRVSATSRSMPTWTSGNFPFPRTLSFLCRVARRRFRLDTSDPPSGPSGCESGSCPIPSISYPPVARTRPPQHIPNQHGPNPPCFGCPVTVMILNHNSMMPRHDASIMTATCPPLGVRHSPPSVLPGGSPSGLERAVSGPPRLVRSSSCSSSSAVLLV